MESGKMRVGIVVNDEMNAFDESTASHRQIALYDDGHYSAILGHPGHVEVDVAASDGPIAEEIFEDAGDLLVGDLGIVGTQGEVRGPGQLGRDHQASGENAGGEGLTAGS